MMLLAWIFWLDLIVKNGPKLSKWTKINLTKMVKSEQKCVIVGLSVAFLNFLLSTTFGTNLWPSTP